MKVKRKEPPKEKINAIAMGLDDMLNPPKSSKTSFILILRGTNGEGVHHATNGEPKEVLVMLREILAKVEGEAS